MLNREGPPQKSSQQGPPDQVYIPLDPLELPCSDHSQSVEIWDEESPFVTFLCLTQYLLIPSATAKRIWAFKPLSTFPSATVLNPQDASKALGVRQPDVIFLFLLSSFFFYFLFIKKKTSLPFLVSTRYLVYLGLARLRAPFVGSYFSVRESTSLKPPPPPLISAFLHWAS